MADSEFRIVATMNPGTDHGKKEAWFFFVNWLHLAFDKLSLAITSPSKSFYGNLVPFWILARWNRGYYQKPYFYKNYQRLRYRWAGFNFLSRLPSKISTNVLGEIKVSFSLVFLFLSCCCMNDILDIHFHFVILSPYPSCLQRFISSNDFHWLILFFTLWTQIFSTQLALFLLEYHSIEKHCWKNRLIWYELRMT
jgi:hypothetical protein